MSEAPLGPRAVTAVELKAQIEAERLGVPFLIYRGPEGDQRIVPVEPSTEELWIGRSSAVAVQLDWDQEVSGLHAQLEFVGKECTLVDDGLSRNGSYVNEDRVRGRRRLRDQDMIRVGRTLILYRSPPLTTGAQTLDASDDARLAASLSPGRRRILIALCRPFKHGAAFASPATNQQIADELFLSIDAVKTHLRGLYESFGIEGLPQNQKRIALVERALQTGAISERDL